MNTDHISNTDIVDLEADSVQEELQYLENIIRRGLHTFLEVGDALMAIRDNKLYLKEYRNFETYCRERWNFSRPRAYQLIGASRIVHELSTNVDEEHLPQNENQVRRLAKLRTKTERLEAWREVLHLSETSGREHQRSEALESVVKLRLESSHKREPKPSNTAKNSRIKPPPVSTDIEHLLYCIEQGLIDEDLQRVCGLVKQLRSKLGF